VTPPGGINRTLEIRSGHGLARLSTPTWPMGRCPSAKVSIPNLAFVYTYVYSMLFTWDSEKSDANLRERGFDFEFAALVFQGTTLEKEDRRKAYGERRVVAVGVAEGFHLTVVYTDRMGATGEIIRRIISARRSNRRERSAYRKPIEG